MGAEIQEFTIRNHWLFCGLMNLLPGERSALWSRLLCLGITAGALYFVLVRVDRQALGGAFLNVQPGWFVAAVFLFGLAVFVASCRWHLVLKLMGLAVHFMATVRTVYIGHFLHTILFGAAGADIGRSALYARWYRFPMSQTLASVSLDRLLGSGGGILLALLVLALAARKQAFAEAAGPIAVRLPGLWVTALVALSILVVFHILRSQARKDSAVGKAVKAFVGGARRLAASPRSAFSGVLAGFIVQFSLCCVLALNLMAVSQGDIPWHKILWVFPVIFAVSSLPITIGGLGVRETAAFTLLGLYGVPANEAVAASLLTFACALFWMSVGGVVLFREERRFRKAAPRQPPKTLSVIIPTLNEEKTLSATLSRLRAVPQVKEIIVVDGGSKDRTRDVAHCHGCRVLNGVAGRGAQLRRGAGEAHGDVILMLHADTWLPPEAGRAALNCLRDGTVVGGGFWKVFRNPSLLMRTSRPNCALRLLTSHRVMADQALFVRREVLAEIGGVPDMPLMEEFELCKRLRRAGRLALAGATVSTSPRRFQRHGVLRTYLRMWRVTLQYHLGTPPEKLRDIYERK
jgi:rSAM/selenodomain-associated transferase 2